jgi:hypothetical protein
MIRTHSSSGVGIRAERNFLVRQHGFAEDWCGADTLERRSLRPILGDANLIQWLNRKVGRYVKR